MDSLSSDSKLSIRLLGTGVVGFAQSKRFEHLQMDEPF
jgi:hypothetical protein